MQLRHLSDKALIQELERLVLEERKISISVLHHLKEVDRRRLYSDLGYSSLYDYGIRKLGYSAGAAHRRVQAARLLGEIPELEKKISDGNLNLTHLADAAGFFREQNVTAPEKKKEVLKEIENLNKRDTATKFRELAGKPIIRMIPVPLSEGTIFKVSRWQGLQARLQSSSDELISGALDVAIADVEKRKFAKVEHPRSVQVAQGVSAETKRTVAERDGHKCTNCGTTHNVQYDHRQPKALGGGNSSENIRLLCFACNQRARIRAGL